MQNENEKTILLARGSYWRRPAPELSPQSAQEVIAPGEGNAFQIYEFLCARLERISRDIFTTAGFDGYIFDLIKIIRDSLARQHDPMMAALMMGQFQRYSIRHSVDAAILVEAMAAEAGIAPLARNPLVAAAMTMNLAMLEMQDKLQSMPRKLPPDVRALMQTHPERSVGMLRKAGVCDERWLSAVSQHHERLDGSGYPASLHDDAISLDAQYVAAADIMLARMNPAAYRDPEVPSKVFLGTYERRGTDLGEDVVSLAIKVLGLYPIGTLARLKNQELAVVTSRGAHFAKPIVKAIIDEFGMPLISPIERDTRKEDFEIVSVIDPAYVGVAINRWMLWDS